MNEISEQFHKYLWASRLQLTVCLYWQLPVRKEKQEFLFAVGELHTRTFPPCDTRTWRSLTGTHALVGPIQQLTSWFGPVWLWALAAASQVSHFRLSQSKQCKRLILSLHPPCPSRCASLTLLQFYNFTRFNTNNGRVETVAFNAGVYLFIYFCFTLLPWFLQFHMFI